MEKQTGHSTLSCNSFKKLSASLLCCESSTSLSLSLACKLARRGPWSPGSLFSAPGPHSVAWLEDGSSWHPREEELLLIDISKVWEEGKLGMDNTELLMVGTVSMNLELNLLGIFELGTVCSCRLFFGNGGSSDSSSSTLLKKKEHISLNYWIVIKILHRMMRRGMD